MKTLARWVSIVAHPFVLGMVAIFGAALHFGSSREALRTLALFGFVGMLPIALLMFRQVRSGSWENVDASNRAERPILYIVSIVALALLLGVTILFRPVSFLTRGAIGVLIMLAVCAVATKWIKVSLHMAFGALSTASLLLLGSPLGWLLLAVMPLLAWSRLALKRHSLAEVVLGLVIGTVTGVAIIVL